MASATGRSYCYLLSFAPRAHKRVQLLRNSRSDFDCLACPMTMLSTKANKTARAARTAVPQVRFFAADVREGILKGLYSGRFVPGQKLIEADLVEAFGRPRSYVRDALLRLEGEGVVETKPFRGAYIRAFTPEQARNIDLTFAALMGLAARQAAQRIDVDDHRARLAAAVEELKVFHSRGGLYEYATTREKFYRLIIAISGNEEIARLCPIMQGHIIRMQTGRHYGAAEHASRLKHFEAVFAAITAGDAAGAEQAVWQSIEDLSHLGESV